MSRIAVYTAIFGGYDNLRVPGVVEADVEYLCFSDCVEPVYPWTVIRKSAGRAKPVFAAKEYKILSTVWMSQFDYTIWIDGNAKLNWRPSDIVDKYLTDNDLALFKHPHRDCIYAEAKACLQMRKGDPTDIQKQMRRYRQLKYPENNGLAACLFIIRKNTDAVAKLENMWWGEIVGGSIRDQLSFPYVMEKCGMKYDVIPGDPFTRFDLVEYSQHKRR